MIINNGVEYKAEAKQTVAVDFSSPNIAKDMHVGHLRSTIIGDATCRILEFLGHNVHRINHVGDWGTQFGMLIAMLDLEYPDFMENTPDLGGLQEFYKKSKKKFDEDPEFKKISQENVVKLQSGDENTIKAWQIICDLSRKEFQQIYDRLHVTLDEVGESFYNPMLAPIVKQLEEEGYVVEDKGAKCFFIKGVKSIKTPLMLQKSDGGFNYDTTDMAAIKYRINELKADRLIYITDMGQEYHFHQIFHAA